VGGGYAERVELGGVAFVAAGAGADVSDVGQAGLDDNWIDAHVVSPGGGRVVVALPPALLLGDVFVAIVVLVDEPELHLDDLVHRLVLLIERWERLNK